jgi:hypothetical protein
VVFCVVVGKVYLAWFPMHIELSLANLISDPVKTHIYGSGSLLFDVIVGDTTGG